MNIEEFMNTIYLGDRACKEISVDGWENKVTLKINLISRIREDSWNFYSKEDIEDGYIVFSGVDFFNLNPGNVMPCDYISNWSVEKLGSRPGKYLVKFDMGGESFENSMDGLELTIHAERVHLEDPKQPGVEITT